MLPNLQAQPKQGMPGACNRKQACIGRRAVTARQAAAHLAVHHGAQQAGHGAGRHGLGLSLARCNKRGGAETTAIGSRCSSGSGSTTIPRLLSAHGGGIQQWPSRAAHSRMPPVCAAAACRGAIRDVLLQ